MLMQLRGYKPIARFILIRLTFSLVIACVLTITLITTVVWTRGFQKTDILRSQHEYRRQSYNLEEIVRINEAKRCFEPIHERSKTHLLDDILEGDLKPNPGKSIFFHETSCIPSGTIVLNARQACAIESAANWNSDRDVFVIFTAKVGMPQNSTIVDALRSYPNIHFRNINLTTYTDGSPMEDWLRSDQLFLSKYLHSHTSDFLRYLSMWRYGGIYLDLDVIVQQSLRSLPANFAAAESDDFVASGAIGFQASGNGHALANLCAREFSSSFNGDLWGHNGPKVLTRVLRRICNTKSTGKMTAKKCRGFHVLSRKAFYAIPSKDWEMFFNPNDTEETLKMTANSVMAHLWNKLSSSQRINQKSAYGIIASRNCPKIFQILSTQIE